MRSNYPYDSIILNQKADFDDSFWEVLNKELRALDAADTGQEWQTQHEYAHNTATTPKFCNHVEASTPMSSAEYNFKPWYYCKKCGQWTRPHKG